MMVIERSLSKLEAPSARRIVALPASTDSDLIAQFDARVRRMFALLDDALADPGAIGDFRQALHQMAGTAAFFGQADLGTMASDFDARLGDPAYATRSFLADARTALRRIVEGAH